MSKLVRIAVVLVAMTLLSGMLGGGRAEAANGNAQWVMDADGRCILFWDGYSDGYSLAGCPRTDGGVDIYYASNGQWVYLSSSGYLSDGGTWLYYQGIYYYDTVSNGFVNGIYPTSATIGAPSWAGLTNNPVANQFVIAASTGSGSVWTAPSCIYVVGGICYH